jgi:trigger factor
MITNKKEKLMQVKETENSGLKRGYKITVPASEVSSEADKRISEIAPTVKMAGFRPGKVPLAMVKKQYGQRIWGEVVDTVISSETRKLFEEKELRPALQPKIEIVSFSEGADLEYTVQLEVLPEIPEVKIKDIKLEKPVVEAKKKDVDEGLKRLVEAQKEYKSLEKERAAKKGDAVIIDYEGKVDDVAFDGGKGTGVRLVLGSGQFIPGYEDQLIGSKKGQSLDVKVTFPKDYGAENLAGKDAVFAVTVQDILEAADAKIDEEFAKKFGFDSVEKLNDAIKEQIEKDYGTVARAKMKKELFDKLETSCEFPVPEGMMEMELEALKQREGASEKKPTKKEQEKTEELARRRIRLGMFLADLGNKEKIEVTEAETRDAVFAQARNFPGQEQQILEYYQQNPQALEQLRGPILEEKVVDYIFEQVQTTEKQVSIEELQKFNEENA